MEQLGRLSRTEVYVRGLKCFGDSPQGFPSIQRVNVVIGRNNTGKSALLDAIKYVMEPFDLGRYGHKGLQVPIVTVVEPLDEESIKVHFPGHVRSSALGPGNDLTYGLQYVGKRLSVEVPSDGKRPSNWSISESYHPASEKYFDHLVRAHKSVLSEMIYLGVDSDRDVRAELDSPEINVAADGSGATNTIQRVLNQAGLDKRLVEVDMLADLNRIMGPDGQFSRISVERQPDDTWVIVLHEDDKGRVSLADSGSGLKTILLVLVNMLVIPALKKYDMSQIAFGFEELENNLHPGLQRRLFAYIDERLAQRGGIAFITTHSPAAIDLFAFQDDAQILHVESAGGKSQVRVALDSGSASVVLDDLGVRASDMLQANGILWVEGISDIIYIRRWIELYCHEIDVPVPVEGLEYAFIEYGGRCLSHIDFEGSIPSVRGDRGESWLIPALGLSRNSFLVMDSDKRASSSKINDTKVLASTTAGRCWITAGREIENYLPDEVAKRVFGVALKMYDSAADKYLANKASKLNKREAAIAATGMLSSIDCIRYDGRAQIAALVEEIGSWNS